MTKEQIHDNFIHFMETERHNRRITMAEMADLLGLTEATYRNIIYKRSNVIDIELPCRLYELTHKWMWQMTGYRTSDNDLIDIYNTLSKEDKETLYQIGLIIRERKK